METPQKMSEGWMLGLFPDTGFSQKIIAFGNAVQEQRDQMWLETLEPLPDCMSARLTPENAVQHLKQAATAAERNAGYTLTMCQEQA